eukprot:Gregarina_sp_Pseudo_9__113@NODE_1077_length_1898_cov_6_932222_g1009_i0_p1_GENE_NODE_1077_length_1898_cov_6_932222_g1009_i0NODE_1077_length_1898_cov_6_932222_g1009_i0_p1_ORF_typecomplete_len421_score58_07FYTT/PF07078_11/0_024_NODE_1077_length_1898_cov_6_932222_g1009_i05121774
MSLNPSVAEAGHSNSGAAEAAPVADSGAMEKLDLTLEEIISTGAGERREGQTSSRIGVNNRHGGRRPVGARHEPRAANATRRPGRAETLVNLKFAGSINKRRNPLNAPGGAISQHQQRTLALQSQRNMLAAKAFQQIPAVAAVTAHQPQIPQQYQQPYPPVIAGYAAWGTGQMPHVFVPAISPAAASYGRRAAPGKFGQASRLGAQDAALLSTEVLQQENGDVIVRFKQTDLVLVKAGTGDLILNSGGYRTFSTKAILNQALQPVGLWVDDSSTQAEAAVSEAPSDGGHQAAPSHSQSQKSTTPEWIVSDRRSYLASFVDGMVIRQAGALSKAQMVARGSVIAQYLRQRKFDAEQKASRSTNGKNLGKRRQLLKAENGGEPDAMDSAPVGNAVIKTEAAIPIYQHQALESVNEDLDQMAE